MHSSVGPTVDAGSNLATWTEGALSRLGELPGVRRVGLALAEGGGRRLRFTASERRSEAGVAWCYVDAYDDVPLNTAVRTGVPVVGALDELRTRYPHFVDRQRGTATVGLAAVPIVAAGQTLGGFVLFLEHGAGLAVEEAEELGRMGAELGAALRRTQRGQGRTRPDLSAEPTPPGALAAVYDVPADLAAVGAVRRFLRRTLDDWSVDEDTLDTAVLCLSELVTNAVMHTHDGCAVRVLLEGQVLTVTVRDDGVAETVPVEQADDPLRTHGRGLQVVDALASRWGSELDAVGTTVWFVLESALST